MVVRNDAKLMKLAIIYRIVRDDKKLPPPLANVCKHTKLLNGAHMRNLP